MPQQIRIVDTTRSYRPVDPDTVPPKLLSDSSLARGDEEPLFPYDGYNFLPTTYGYKSFFGELNALGADPLPPNQDALFTFQNIEYHTSIIALGEAGIFVKWNTDGADTTWLHIELPVDADIYKPWTYALLNNNLYMYRAFDPHFYVIYFDPAKALLHPDYDSADPVWKYRPYKLTPSFLNMEGQVGLFRAGIRLGFWDAANAVAVSSVDDPTDFTPSVATMAGVSTFSHVEGRITHILPFKDGFVIYAMANIVLVERDLSSSLLWSTRIIFDRGVAYRRQVVSEKTYEVHYAITESAVIQIEGGRVSKIVPELYERMQATDKPYFLYLLDERYLCFMNIDSKQARKIRSRIYDSRLVEQAVQYDRPSMAFPAYPPQLHESELPFLYSDWTKLLQDSHGSTVQIEIAVPALSTAATLEALPANGSVIELPGVGPVTLNDALPHYVNSFMRSGPQYNVSTKTVQTNYSIDEEARLLELKVINFLYSQKNCMRGILDEMPMVLRAAVPGACPGLIKAVRVVGTGELLYYNRIDLLENFIHRDIKVDLYRNIVSDYTIPSTEFSDQGLRVAARATEVKKVAAVGDIVHIPFDGYRIDNLFGTVDQVVWNATTSGYGTTWVTEDPDYESHLPPQPGTGFERQIVDKTWDNFAAYCVSVLPLSQDVVVKESFPFAINVRTPDTGTTSVLEVSLVGSCANQGGAVVGFTQVWYIYADVSGECYNYPLATSSDNITYWHQVQRVVEDEDDPDKPAAVGGFLQLVRTWQGDPLPGVTPWSGDIDAALNVPALLNTTIPGTAAVSTNPLVSNSGQIGNTPYYINSSTYSTTCRRNLPWGYNAPPLPPFTVSIVQGSHEIPYPKYEGCFLYDTNLQKWGKQVGPSSAWFSLVPINRADPLVVEARELVRQAGYLRTDGNLILFSDTPEASEIVFGKLGVSRTGFTDAERVILHMRKSVRDSSSGTNLYITLEKSHNGRGIDGEQELIVPDERAVLFDLPVRASARWYNVVVRGWYDISYLEFRGSVSGRR